jgi:L-ascorbate metabolism protein UlaG (beta-lactamase superfamily)
MTAGSRDPDAVLDWFGCATFRLTVGDTVVFLDAYIDRVPGAPGPGLRADDIDRADWVVVGHSHFDHLWGAERIARRTGATMIGSYETVRIMASEGVPPEQLIPVSGGERIRLSDDVVVSVYPSLHSCVWTHAAMHQSDYPCLGDVGLTWQERRERYAGLRTVFDALDDDGKAHVTSANQGALGDGGALVYLFDTPRGTLLYQDTSGHWSGILSGLRPDVAILAAAGRGNVDGEPVQGTLARYVARQAELLRPRRVLLSHHDDWMPGFSVDTKIAPIRDELARALPFAELAEIGYVTAYPVFEGLR